MRKMALSKSSKGIFDLCKTPIQIYTCISAMPSGILKAEIMQICFIREAHSR